jgi:hypothetical protein
MVPTTEEPLHHATRDADPVFALRLPADLARLRER